MLHRDLKPKNIGFDRNGILKVFDFDVSRVVPYSKEGDDKCFHLTAKIGSLRYMSPEVSQGRPYNLKADVYSFGLLVYRILSLKTPYQGMSREDMNLKVMTNGQRPSIPKALKKSPCLSTFLQSCWSERISERPNMKTAREMLETTILPSILAKVNKTVDDLSLVTTVTEAGTEYTSSDSVLTDDDTFSEYCDGDCF